MDEINTKEMTRDEFLIKYKGYADVLATKFINEVKDSRIEFEDLYQTGCLALLENFDKYNSEKASYSTFAYVTVYYAMLNYINSNNRLTYVPINLVIICNLYRKKQQEFYMMHGREMNISESIDLVKGIKAIKTTKVDEGFINLLNELNKFHITDNHKSLKQFINSSDIEEFRYDNNSDPITIEELLVSDSNTEDDAIDRYLLRNIYECLARMPDDISRKIFIDLMGLNDGIIKTKASLREKYGITSGEGINYHYNKVMQKLKKNINKRI